MSTSIRHKKSSVAGRTPGAGDLQYGELAINYNDGRLHYKTSTNDVKAFVDSAGIETIITRNFGQVDAHLLPTTNITYDLGSDTNRFRDLYLSGQSIKLGTITITDSDGSISFKDSTNTNAINVNLDGNTTTDLAEGTNLYYTDARVDNRLTGGTGVTYTTGTIAIGQDVGTNSNVTFADTTVAKLTADSANLDNIKFTSLNTAPSNSFGTLYYDSDEQKGPSITLRTLENTAPGVTLNLGQEILLYVHNLTGAQVSNGDVVYISGTAHGKHPQISLAKADASSTAQPTGVATMDIPNGGHGWVTRYGMVRDLDTSAYSAGDVLYLSKDSDGKLTNTSVTVNDGYPVHVARVMTADASNGMILVDPFSEHFEYLRVQDEILVDGKITADSADLLIANFNTTRWTDINVPDNLPTKREGNLFYFQGPDALAYTNSEINVKIGQDEVIRVYNNSGADIPKGKVVYVTGAANDFPTISLARANAFNTVYNTIGLTSHAISNGSFGFVTYSGLYGGIDTTKFNLGDFLHVSPDSAGEMVAYSPDFPNWPFQIGSVLVVDSAGGGNVGGCIQVRPTAEIAENIRTEGNLRVDGNLTIAGNINILGTETKTTVSNLNVSDNFVYIGAGDTITTNFTGTGLNDGTFKDYYEGDSDKTYYVRIKSIDSAGGGGDTIEWAFDSDFSTILGFDSASGATEWSLGNDGKENIPLRYNITMDFTANTGHTTNDRWYGDASPTNQDLGWIGNYNLPDAPYSHAGFFRDASDQKFKVFNKYDPEVSGDINTSDASFELGTMVASAFEGDLTGDVTGNASTATLLENPRTIAISGDVTGTATSFNGGSNITISSSITADTIVNADIKSDAAIADTKLATISTAGKVQNSATTATNANTASAIVARDASGNFSANNITGNEFTGTQVIYANGRTISNALTTTSTSVSNLITFGATNFGAMKVFIQGYNSTEGERMVTELSIVHDGTTASSAQYGTVFTGSSTLGQFEVDIDSGNVRLRVTPTYSSSTVWKVMQIRMDA